MESDFQWTAKKERLALLIAEGRITHAEQACELGVAESTVYNWQKHPEFRRRVDELVRELGLAQKTERIKHYKRVVEAGFQEILRRLEGEAIHEEQLATLLRETREYVQLLREELGDTNTPALDISILLSERRNEPEDPVSLPEKLLGRLEPVPDRSKGPADRVVDSDRLGGGIKRAEA